MNLKKAFKALKDKTAQSLGGMQALAIGLVVVAIIIAFGARVTTDVGAQLTGTAAAAASNGTQALADMSSFLPLLAIVGVAAVIIAFLVGAFGRLR